MSSDRSLPMFDATPAPDAEACTDDCCSTQANDDASVTDDCCSASAQAPGGSAGDGCCSTSDAGNTTESGQDTCCSTQADGKTASQASVGTTARVVGAERTVVRVTGMDCASCAVTIEKSVGRLPGVARATVNFAAGRLDAEHSSTVDRDAIEAAVRRAGYGIEAAGAADRDPFWSQRRVQLTAAGLALFSVGALLWALGAPDTASSSVYALASLIGGLPIYRSAIKSAREKVADVNVLMSLAVIGAAIIGAWGEAALVVILFSVSNALQVYAVGRTRGAVRALARLTPDEVLVRRDGRDTPLPVDQVAVGDIVVVRPGERIGVDGEITDGTSALDESPVTGESVPVEKGAGDTVFSGSLNGPGGLLVTVTKPAGESTLQRITRMVEDAQGTRAPVEQLVDRFTRIYTPVVLLLAVLVALVPPLLFGGEFDTWFYRALVLLIVSCPCALIISTPVSIVSGIGAASRRGILIKGGEALEAAGKLTALFFDKTGTLTEGRPVLEQVLVADQVDRKEALRLAAALERRSEHPLAHAILTAAGDTELPDVTDFTSITGRGAEGDVDGHRYLVGSPRLFAERDVSLDGVADHLHALEDAGQTPVILGTPGGALAVFGLADAIRPDAAAALAALRDAGVERLVMLTGDAEAPARRVADELGIEYRARLLPEDKVAAIAELALDDGATGMVGDGINDAPALAAADVSFAMGAAGTDAALDAADIALMADDLSKVAEAVALSRAAERTIKQNIAVSILINGSFTLLAPIGIIPLWLAVLEDALSSIGVTANSLRLFRRTSTPMRERSVTASSADQEPAPDGGCEDGCCSTSSVEQEPAASAVR